MSEKNNFNINTFCENYLIMSNNDLMIKYDLTKNQLKYLQRKYKLLKPKNLINYNKTLYKTKNDILNIVNNFKTFNKFRISNPHAYKAALKFNCVDEIRDLFIPINYSAPQLIIKDIMDTLLNQTSLYNTRKIIKPYEIDVFYPEINLGFEYNSKKYHENKKNIDELKTHLCNDKGITLIHINETNRKYESDIKNQLIQNLSLINISSKIKITSENILNFKVDYEKYIYNKKEIIKLCEKYDDIKIFIKEQPQIFNLLNRYKLSYKYLNHMYKRKYLQHDEITINLNVNKFKTLAELRKKDNALYLICIRHYPHLLTTFKNPIITWDEVKNKISNYTHYNDFIKNELKYYNYCLKHNKQNYLNSNLIRERNEKHIFTDSLILKKIESYINFKDFVINNKKMYNYIQKYNKIHLLDNLVRYRKININVEDYIPLIKSCLTLKEFSIKYNKEYNYVRNNYKHFLLYYKGQEI